MTDSPTPSEPRTEAGRAMNFPCTRHPGAPSLNGKTVCEPCYIEQATRANHNYFKIRYSIPDCPSLNLKAEPDDTWSVWDGGCRVAPPLPFDEAYAFLVTRAKTTMELRADTFEAQARAMRSRLTATSDPLWIEIWRVR